MKAYMLGAVVICGIATAAEARDCYVPGFNAVDNGVATGQMIVTSGRPCGISRGAGNMMAITGNRIVRPPKFGRAGVTMSAIGYMSRAGYVGPDAFTFQTIGRDRYGRPVVQTVQVQVNVTP